MSLAAKSVGGFFASLGALPFSLIILVGQTPCLAQPRGEPEGFLKTVQFLDFGEVKNAPPHL